MFCRCCYLNRCFFVCNIDLLGPCQHNIQILDGRAQKQKVPKYIFTAKLFEQNLGSPSHIIKIEVYIHTPLKLFFLF